MLKSPAFLDVSFPEALTPANGVSIPSPGMPGDQLSPTSTSNGPNGPRPLIEPTSPLVKPATTTPSREIAIEIK